MIFLPFWSLMNPLSKYIVNSFSKIPYLILVLLELVTYLSSFSLISSNLIKFITITLIFSINKIYSKEMDWAGLLIIPDRADVARSDSVQFHCSLLQFIQLLLHFGHFANIISHFCHILLLQQKGLLHGIIVGVLAESLLLIQDLQTEILWLDNCLKMW